MWKYIEEHLQLKKLVGAFFVHFFKKGGINMIVYLGGFFAMFKLIVTVMANTISDSYSKLSGIANKKPRPLESGYG